MSERDENPIDHPPVGSGVATATTDGGPGTTGERHPPKRLYRRTDDRMIAGVASGLGDYFNIDPILFRIGFILLAFAGGAGVFLYLALWWFVPPTEEVSGRGEDAVRRLKTAPTWVAMVLLIVGAGLLLDQLDVTSSQIIWGLALVGLGVLLFRHATGRPIPGIPLGPPAPPPAPPPSPPAPPSPGPALGPSPVEPPSPLAFPPWASTAHWSQPRRPRRERSGLGWATLGLALIAGGVAAMLDNAGIVDLSLSQYLATGLAVVGIGMLVGSWWGRARWLIIPALLLTPAVLVGSLVNVPFRGGFGDRLFMPRGSASTDVTHNLIAGKLRLDLTRLPSDGPPARFTATIVAGELDVIVPRGTHVAVNARVGAGSMELFRIYADGVSVERRLSKGPQGGRDIQLNLAVSFGRIQIIHG